MKTKDLLLPFYFGSISEEERIHMERELLTDSEVLTDFLDLKRDLEAAGLIVNSPSENLWQNLKPKTIQQKRFYISLSLGAALAAGIAIIVLIQSQPKARELIQPPISQTLFDSSSELPASSGVL